MDYTVLSKSLMTWLKYAGWTAAGALVTTLIDTIGNLHLPIWVALLVASLLKTLATAIATHQTLRRKAIG